MNTIGYNLDIGLPLENKQAFDLLYVNSNSENEIRFKNWLSKPTKEPIIITGQIGTGKTTFLNKVLIDNNIKPDIKVDLNNIITITSGSIWGGLLGKCIAFAIENNINIEEYNFKSLYNDLFLNDLEFSTVLISNFKNFKTEQTKENLYKLIDSNFQIIFQQIKSLIIDIEEKLDKNILFYVEGIDKIPNYNANYLIIIEYLNFLSENKTIFECNLIHLFCDDEWIANKEKITILNFIEVEIFEQLIDKRTGIYNKQWKQNYPKLFELSGGNYRQAIRLFSEFEFANRQLNLKADDAFNYTIKKIRTDFIIFQNSPVDILKVIKKDGFISSGVIKYNNGNELLFKNLILIIEEQDNFGNFKSIINPLIHEYLEKEIFVEEDENNLNIKEIYHSLSSFFLKPDKNEIIIIIYDNLEIAKVSENFIFGKALSFNEGSFEHYEISNRNFLKVFEQTNKDFESIFFKNELNDKIIEKLEHTRDALIRKKMIWWIEQKFVTKYFNNWIQLRQFVKIFKLNENILSKLNIEDLEKDIETIDYMEYTKREKDKIKQDLQTVINYLEQNQNASKR